MVVQKITHTSTKEFILAIRNTTNSVTEALAKFDKPNLNHKHVAFVTLYKTDSESEAVDVLADFSKTHQNLNGFIGSFNLVDNNVKTSTTKKKRGGVSIKERSSTSSSYSKTKTTSTKSGSKDLSK